ncbi:MAG TPA: SAM-dependent methyltransferase, partial [Burkholderiaceae bacterium]|nr:SAM-dependent methyltransferase [Burkholderiaceae bacterium]
SDLRVIGYEDGFLSAPERFVQRIAALREAGGAGVPVRHAL